MFWDFYIGKPVGGYLSWSWGMILLTAVLDIFGIVFTLISTTNTTDDPPVADDEFTDAAQMSAQQDTQVQQIQQP